MRIADHFERMFIDEGVLSNAFFQPTRRKDKNVTTNGRLNDFLGYGTMQRMFTVVDNQMARRARDIQIGGDLNRREMTNERENIGLQRGKPAEIRLEQRETTENVTHCSSFKVVVAMLI